MVSCQFDANCHATLVSRNWISSVDTPFLARAYFRCAFVERRMLLEINKGACGESGRIFRLRQRLRRSKHFPV